MIRNSIKHIVFRGVNGNGFVAALPNRRTVKSVLDRFEGTLRQIEESLFDGPFCAAEVEKKLQLVVFSENLKTMSDRNLDALHNNPLRKTVVDTLSSVGMQSLADKIATGQQLSSGTVTLSEKKNDYQKIFDGISETITVMKDRLEEMQETIPKNNRLLSLLERYEKCGKEIGHIRDVIGSFSSVGDESQPCSG